MKKQSFTIEEALEKAKNFCAYQERCVWDVHNKLQSFGLQKNQCEWIIRELIKHNFICESRYACSFTEGKVHLKGWGKQKIIQALRRKQISEGCIEKAVFAIENIEYKQNIKKQADKWIRTHSHLPINEQKLKLIRYLFGKGYEYTDIQEFINYNLRKDNDTE